MREAEKNPRSGKAPEELPRGLFSHIIKRLGFEKELIFVKRYILFFSCLLVAFILLSALAFIGIREVLARSSFGPFLSLIFSDPVIVVLHWKSFVLAFAESMPLLSLSLLLFALAFMLLFLRWSVYGLEKFFILMRKINSQKYEQR